ncbi:MAG: Fe-S cluster assembly protein IscX [Chloroflexota bacterium]|nr:Fe-S cluster assembly protein IscX [Anaerolineales bacterium]MCA9974616.1 Fe-S cluster assembly protein IscX [Anaerolineales bacterium]MCB8968877.1 Fe-S cluster assembly protein IscX [Ardenticatenaceae bacterium]
MTGNAPELYWDSTYAIVMALIEHYPEKNPESIGLHELMDAIQTLPGFNDDPAIVTEQVLLDILNVWYEETVSL